MSAGRHAIVTTSAETSNRWRRSYILAVRRLLGRDANIQAEVGEVICMLAGLAAEHSVPGAQRSDWVREFLVSAEAELDRIVASAKPASPES